MTRKRVLRPVGCFEEFLFPRSTGSLKGSLPAAGAQPVPDEDRIISYLRGGARFLEMMVKVPDFLDPTLPVIGTGVTLTDGTWLWPSVLAYFVAHYHLVLAPEFIEHVRRNNYVVPSRVRVEDLSAEAAGFADEDAED